MPTPTASDIQVSRRDSIDAPEEFYTGLGEALIRIRRLRGLSQYAVEVTSGGRFKAVVIGSYERGDRHMRIGTLVELARFYDVPVETFLPDANGDTLVPLKALTAHLSALGKT